MMEIFQQIRGALQNLNPHDVRELAEQQFTVGVLAEDDEAWQRAVGFLMPAEISERKAQEAGRHILRVETEADLERCDFGIAEGDVNGIRHFYPRQRAIRALVERHEELWIPVARHFLAFREAVVERLIRKVARENALFAVATAIPNIVPSFVELPWSVGEFASDTAVLTMNQIRLAFLIAAASDAEVGYRPQKGQIASIVTSAFGWRALAREAVSKIPFGGGVVPKGVVAYAGT
ncbi:MAG: hypothetical protein HY238_23005, partial [Acidobacteria bacterium]|nr:hypothetical protein [Acidobacteriota bacterium]